MNWWLLSVPYIGLLSVAVLDNVKGPVLPLMMRDLAISDAQAGLYFALASLASMLPNLTMPIWHRRFGALYSFRLFVVLIAISSWWLGRAQSATDLYIASILSGVGMGGVSFCNNFFVAEAAPPKKLARAYSILHSMYGLGSLLAPAVLSAMIAKDSNLWRTLLQWLCVLPLISLLQSFWVHGKKDVSERKSPKRPRRNFILWFSCVVGFYVSAEILISSRLVLYLHRSMGESVEIASQNLMFYFLFLMLGRLLGGVVHVPVHYRKLLVVSNISSFLAVALGLWLHPFFLLLAGFTMSVFYPTTVAWLADEFAEVKDVVVNMMIFSSGLFIMCMHYIVGVMTQSQGIEVAMRFALFSLFASTVLLVKRVPKHI